MANLAAWVLGAVDPNSGTASQHEVIRGVGALLAKGWKPLRTIVFASWDAEEYGLIGSTEWTEDFASFLVKDGTYWKALSAHGLAAAYINMDESASGSKFAVAASPVCEIDPLRITADRTVVALLAHSQRGARCAQRCKRFSQCLGLEGR